MGLSQSVNAKLYTRTGNAHMRVGSCAMNGYREEMEDAHTHILKMRLHPSYAYFGLFDGHLGDQASKWCADFLHIYLDSLKEFTPEAMRGACLRADQDLKQLIHNDGCTGIFCLAEHPANPENPEKPWKMIVGNVGDSRCMLARDGVTLESLSEDHKPNNPEELKRITDSGGFVRNNRVNGDLAISRAFGDFSYKRNQTLGAEEQAVIAVPDFIEAKNVGGDDFMVLCCDGFLEVLDNATIIKFIADEMANGEQDLAVIGGNLCDLVAQQGGRDNMSIMIIQFKDGRNYAQPDQFIPVSKAEFKTHVDRGGARWLHTYKRFVENCANMSWDDVIEIYGPEAKELLIPERTAHDTPQWMSVPVSIQQEEPPASGIRADGTILLHDSPSHSPPTSGSSSEDEAES